MRNLISLTDFTGEELTQLLNRADYMADAWKENKMPQPLANKQVALWFYGQGFRNRIAFEIGARAMGASVTYIPGELGVHEPLEDIGRYLDNWFSMLVVRARRHQDLLNLAAGTDMPIINARTDINHPCEIVGDLQYIRRCRGSLTGLNVVFVGEVTNLCMSWFEAAVRLPISVTQVAPAGYTADKNILQSFLCMGPVGRIAVSNDLEDMLEYADVIYTDCWPHADTPEDKQTIHKLFMPYQIKAGHFSIPKHGVIFLPCPPVTRGEEVSSEAMESVYCMNYQAKEYLLHSQNAVMEFLAAK